MPKFVITTISAKSIWKSQDGAREIFQIEGNYQGKRVEAKTYSRQIATEGWAGEVETYEQGGDTFIRQPKSEYKVAGYGGGNKSVANEDMMKLAYAKDIAVALIDAGMYDSDLLYKIVTEVGAGAEMFGEPPKKELEPKDELLDVEDPKETINNIFGKPADKDEAPWPKN